MYKKGRWHWIIFTLLIVGSWWIGDYLEHSSAMIGLKYSLYRYETRLHLHTTKPPQITAVVLLNDDDYWSEYFAARSPLRRDRLGEIITILAAEGVRTVAMDIDLRSPNRYCPGCDYEAYSDEDAKFAESLKHFCATKGNELILGTSLRFANRMYSEVPSLYTWSKASPSEADAYACIHPGYLQLPHDLRQFPGQLVLANGGTVDSFAMAAVQQLPCHDAYRLAVRPPEKGFRFSSYFSEAEFSPYVFSAKELPAMYADPHSGLRQKLAGRIVLIGGGWHTTAIEQGPRTDTYNSPMGMMPGVFLHANYIEALATKSGTFAPVPDWVVKMIEYALVGFLAYLGLDEERRALKWFALVGCVVISIALVEFLMNDIGLFMDFLIPLCLVFGHSVVEEFFAGWLRLRKLEKNHEVPS